MTLCGVAQALYGTYLITYLPPNRIILELPDQLNRGGMTIG
jgi:hypothetical protein